MSKKSIHELYVTKTDQLNNDDLRDKDLVGEITGYREGSREQPVQLYLSCWDKPYRPCKTVGRALGEAWNLEFPEDWVGRSLRLIRDPTVEFGSDKTGGIRVSHISHIDRPVTVLVKSGRGRMSRITFQPLKTAAPPSLLGISEQHGVTLDQIDRWHRKRWNNPMPEPGTDAAAGLAQHIANTPSAIEEIRAIAKDSTMGRTTHGSEE